MSDPTNIFDPVVKKAMELGISDLVFSEDGVYGVRHGVMRPFEPDVDWGSFDPDLVKTMALDLFERKQSLAPKKIRAESLAYDPDSPLFDGDIASRPDEKHHEVEFDDRKEMLLEHEGSVEFAASFPSGRIRFQIAKASGNIVLFARIIPNHPGTFQDLNLPEKLRYLPAHSDGLFLVTGPTGSGKTTTAAAILDYFNRTTNSIIVTVEDPVEFVHKPHRSIVIQREIGGDTPSYAKALTDAMRQRPNVIFIGEIRDRYTLEQALRLATTGHFVLATYHTNSAAHTISRIINSFPENQRDDIRDMLANVLIGVNAQRLLPRIDNSGLVLASETWFMGDTRSVIVRNMPPKRIYDNTKEVISFDRSIRALYRQKLISRDVAEANMSPEALKQQPL